MTHANIEQQTKQLIDDLKATCASYGLGNDGNEYKIITQVFLYKFLNDKFGYEVKHVGNKNYKKRLENAEIWEEELLKFKAEEFEDLLTYLPADSPKLKPEHFISQLYNQQNKGDFSTLFDATMVDIANYNASIFSVKTDSETIITLFEPITIYIPDLLKRDNFARALISKLANFNFERVFKQKYDFFSTIFEYLIKDYNKDGGGKYAEYYTPHAVSKIMASILVNEPVSDASVCDPSAGSGTLLMALAHAIGEDRCTIYSQDISQKSSKMLRLNLILNNLVHSIPNVIQGDTMVSPYHKDERGALQKFDYIVSNPPFKLDFSDTQAKLITDSRFFAGVPNVPNKDKDKMSIYLLFIQHIIHSLKENTGKAAIVVPTGFITAQSGIERKIREKLVEDKMLRGVVSMPSNIFATTNTNVSILFLDKSNITGNIILMDASKLGSTVKEDKNQKTLLSVDEENLIVNTFNKREVKENFTVLVSYEQIKGKNYILSAGHYFDVKIKYSNISHEEFTAKLIDFSKNLDSLFTESNLLEKEIKRQLGGLKYD